MGDAQDMVEKIHDVAKLVESGSDAIEKELEQTYENVLGRKLGTPEGMALIKAKIAEIEGASTAAPAAAAPAPAAPAALRLRRPGQVVSNIPVRRHRPGCGHTRPGRFSDGSRTLCREPPENRRPMMKSKTFLLSVVLLALIAGCETPLPPEQGHQGGCQRPRCWPLPLPGASHARGRSQP